MGIRFLHCLHCLNNERKWGYLFYCLLVRSRLIIYSDELTNHYDSGVSWFFLTNRSIHCEIVQS